MNFSTIDTFFVAKTNAVKFASNKLIIDNKIDILYARSKLRIQFSPRLLEVRVVQYLFLCNLDVTILFIG